MKQTVSWHEQCLVNMKRSLADARSALETHRLRVHKLQDEVDLAERQIAEAKRRGMEAFDDERLLVKRAKTT
jgi:hypothetical protein